MGLITDYYGNLGKLVAAPEPRVPTRDSQNALGRKQFVPNKASIAEAILSITPILGDVLSAKDTAASLSEGNYGEAALNGVGLLPFIPSLAGMVKFHGTSTGTLSKIMKDGIKPHARDGLGVAEFEGAKGFADSSMNYAGSHGAPAVLKLDIPDEAVDWMRLDMGSPRGAGSDLTRNYNIGLKGMENIPPGMIKDVTIRGRVYELLPDGTIGREIGSRKGDYGTGSIEEYMYK